MYIASIWQGSRARSGPSNLCWSLEVTYFDQVLDTVQKNVVSECVLFSKKSHNLGIRKLYDL